MSYQVLEDLVGQVNVPTGSSKIYKDECVYSFANAESPDGLYIDLNSFLAFSKQYVTLNYEKTKHRLYLNIRHTVKRIEKQENENQEPPKKKSMYGIPLEHEEKYNIEEALAVVILPEFTVLPLPDGRIPPKIQKSFEAILAADSETRKQAVTEYVGEVRPSAFALSLVQLQNGVKIPPSGWKCSKCDLNQNLWLNITDGTLLCGRRNYDGSGGNGHALDYYKETGYPIAVKLGTISATGPADVFSYPEDDMVEDPLLVQHLEHFGINISQMQKTDKSMAELELDASLKYDYSRVEEEGVELQKMYGSGFTGIRNIGNSCYMASVMQTVFSLPEFNERYGTTAEQHFKNAPSDPASDLQTQLAKFAHGLHSGRYSNVPETNSEKDDDKNERGTNGINPRMLKTLIGKGHPEFSTMRQQDALEFFQHLMTSIERDEHKRESGKHDPSKIFRLNIQERIECSSSHQVKYTSRSDNVLSLSVPVDKSVIEAQERREKEAKERRDKEAKDRASGTFVEEQKAPEVYDRPHVTLMDCFKAFGASEAVPDFYSAAIGAKTVAIRSSRLASFPDYLVIHLRKFFAGSDWIPRKLDVTVDVPEDLDIEFLRGNGPQPNETLLSEPASNKAAAPEFKADEEIVQSLMGMGFPRVRCERAAFNVKNANADAAMNWLFEHMEDPDIDTPLPKSTGGASAPAAPAVSAEGIEMLMGMGFTKQQATKALKETNNDIERATEWIFSHSDDPMDTSESASSSAAPAAAATTGDAKDGRGQYSLYAFVSHVGSHAQSGHYVCHIKKNGKWVLFNDAKVVASEKVPFDLGYLYVFKRK